MDRSRSRRERIWRACEKFSSRSRLYLRATLHRSMNSPRLTFPSLPPHPFFARYISCLFKLRSQSELYDWLWFFFFFSYFSLVTHGVRIKEKKRERERKRDACCIRANVERGNVVRRLNGNFLFFLSIR